MVEYYHYTEEKYVDHILKTGMWQKEPVFTTNKYYNARQAGNELGVRQIDCVLLFKNDGLFKPYIQPIVPRSHGDGGAPQFIHPYRPKPVAKRKINEQNWTKF